MKKTLKKGFTLVELIIVIAVVAILIAVLVPTFVSVINKANRSAFEQNAVNLYRQAALDKIGEGQSDYFAYYTDGKEYIAFNSLNKSIRLGAFDTATNTFAGDANKNFCLGLTNDGFRILLHKAGGDFDAPERLAATDSLRVYSLIGENGEDPLINASRFDPLFFAYRKDSGEIALFGGENTAVCAYKSGPDGSDNPILMARYQANYGGTDDLTGVLPVFSLPPRLEIPLTVAGNEIGEVGELAGGAGIANVTALTLPEGITAMTAGLNGAAPNLSAVKLPSTLVSLPPEAFTGAALSSVKVPDNVVFGTGKYFDDDVQLTFTNNVCLSAETIKQTENSTNAVSHEQVINGFATLNEALKTAAFVDVYEDIAGASAGVLPLSGLIRKDCKLTVPYAEGKPVMEYNANYSAQTLLPAGQKTMTLQLDGDLVVEGTLELGAMRNTTTHGLQGHITGAYAELDLNGHRLEVRSGGTVFAPGLIVDNAGGGQLEVKAGGVLKTPFVVKDFSGGSLCAGRYFGGVAPFNQYCVPYVRADTRIEYGGRMHGLCVLYASSKHNETDQVVIGEKGLIELTEPGSYVLKTYDAGLETLAVYGKAKSNSMSIKVGIFTPSTENTYFPIPNGLTLVLKKGGEFRLQTMTKVLPGAKIVTEAGSRLVFDKLSSKCAGRLVVYSNYPNCTNPDHAAGKGVTCTQNFAAAQYPQGLFAGGCALYGDVIFTSRPDLDFAYCLAGDVAAGEQLQNALTADVLTKAECAEGGSKGSVIASFQQCFTVTEELRLIEVTNGGETTVYNYRSIQDGAWTHSADTYLKTADGYRSANDAYIYEAATGLWHYRCSHGGGSFEVVFKNGDAGQIYYLSMIVTDNVGTPAVYAYKADIGKWIKG